MQLQLTPGELQLTIDLLETRDCDLRGQIERADRKELSVGLHNEEHFLTELENKLIARDFQLSADELDFLASELRECQKSLDARLAASADSDLLISRTLLQHVHDKVTEACAMA